MPSIPRSELTRRLLLAFEDSGASVQLLSSETTNPRRILVEFQGKSVVVLAYLWTLTFGGRRSLPNEYRIQMTGVQSPLCRNTDGPTLLLGFEGVYETFAGFDVSKHTVFTEGSPSVQIDIDVVRQARTIGMAFQRKSNGEVVCGICPDHMLAYTLSDGIYDCGRVKRDFEALERATQGLTITDQMLERLAKPRRRTVTTVERWTRNCSFRRLVMQAYEHRCAVSGTQLRLVDAAHIIPTGVVGSTDEVTNGIALSPTFHRAYDRGLLFIDTDYRVRLSQAKIDELEHQHLLGGLPEFRRLEGQRIILPANTLLQPSREYLQRANALRDAI